MAIQLAELKKTTDQKMDKTIQAFKADLAKVRTGRAHTGILDHVQVDYYGSQTPLNQVARVTLLDARTIGVSPFEKKMVQAVEKAIRESDLGLNPAAQGDTIRVPMPALTEERRKELTKVVHKEAETARVAVRNVRRDAIHALKEALASSVDIQTFDLDTQFALRRPVYGLVFLFGVLYHLRNPFYVLESLAHQSRYCLMSTRIARFAPDQKTRLANSFGSDGSLVFREAQRCGSARRIST
jgi:ribosome recycling factor